MQPVPAAVDLHGLCHYLHDHSEKESGASRVKGLLGFRLRTARMIHYMYMHCGMYGKLAACKMHAALIP